MKPISVQLYSLREEAKNDHMAVLKKLADIGYKGVEPFGNLFGMTPKEFCKVITDLGMVISSSHSPWTSVDNIEQAVETAGIFGVDMVGSGFGPDAFKTLDAIKQTADTVNQICEKLKPSGLKLFMHNHYWEFEEVAGQLAYDHFAPLAPDVLFEIDTYWASNFGANNVPEQVIKFKDRTPLLHIKDGPLMKDEPMTAAGQGKMDIPAVIQAADDSVLQWLIVELDRCATDMMTAVLESYKYLTEKKLADGNK